ncbi:MAG: type II secretion system protein [Deltaproteobacteria bacterium]|nr:type II secretion system protein [Deltaproteobacteria bacterium]
MGIVIGVLGILAAVAIPAFINYMKRAKTTEATVNVTRCYEGAVAYFESQKTLPQSADWTPAQTPSGDGATPGDGTTSLFRREGAIENGAIVPSEGIFKENPLE